MPTVNEDVASPNRDRNSTPLAGARVWLSVSVDEQASESERTRTMAFVRLLAQSIFADGGHIVHGSEPSITQILIEEASSYQERGGSKDCLILCVSRYWSKNPEDVAIEVWQKAAVVYETPEVPGPQSRNDSLALLRKWMAARSDAVILLGGRKWKNSSSGMGIPSEFSLAFERGLPCFLLGGFGGAAEDLINKNPDILKQLRNGLALPLNDFISKNEDAEQTRNIVCDQLRNLPLVRGRGSDGSSFRILALDGGGLKGAFTAAAIATWEEQTGLRVADHFDLVAGTSTGGILALGIGLGLSGSEMLKFYVDRGPVIFPITRLRSKASHVLRHIFKPKYSQETLYRELRLALYGNGQAKRLKDSRCRLVIPAYHAVAGESHLFRTPHHQDLTADANTEAADAALATSAAPTFFSAAKIANMVADSSYFDGGVWANSPAMAAIVEATCFLRIPLERIDVLSLGTTEEPFTLRHHTRAGIVKWLWKKKILDLLMNVQQESSLRLAQHLVGEPRFLRVNVVTAPGSYHLDGPDEIGELADLGNHTALKTEILAQVKSRFLNGVHATPWRSYA